MFVNFLPKNVYEPVWKSRIVGKDLFLCFIIMLGESSDSKNTICVSLNCSYIFLGGKIENIKFTNKFITDIIENNTQL